MAANGKPGLWIAAAAIILSTLAAMAYLHHSSHDHAHHLGAQAGLDALRLNGDARWPTDAGLRDGMRALHDLLTPHDQPDASLDAASAAALAKDVRMRLNRMIADCKLEPDADEVLHVLIAEMFAAAEQLARPDQFAQGMTRARAVLEHYPRYFDHPGWNVDHGG